MSNQRMVNDVNDMSELRPKVGRRRFLRNGGVLSAAALSSSVFGAACGRPMSPTSPTQSELFWPGGEQLVVSISMQFEATAQGSHAEGPFPPIEAGYPDTITPSWYQYGMNEGIPRLLDLWDAHDIKVTSHMVGRAAELNPGLAREVVTRGHEASGHGQSWTPQYSMSADDERASYVRSAATIEETTGMRPLGFNAFWMRHSVQTLEILQDLGFIYHIDDLSRDEPSITPVRGRPFAVIPYTFRNNDIVRYSGSTAMTGAAYLQELKDEFDVLYREGASRRRMMSVSAHDRIAGSPARAKALGDFITYAKSHANVSFMRKDDIARFALEQDGMPRTPARVFQSPTQNQ